MIRTAVRARKYRADWLVHRVSVAASGGRGGRLRTCQILCTSHWVFPHQLEFVDKPATCITCVAARGAEA